MIDKHLVVRRHEREGPRILMLETVHQYAHERLAEQKDAGDVYRRHCLYYLALTERAEPELFTHGEGEWLPRFEAEIDNLRAALDWGLHHGDPALALRMASLLAMFWETSGRQAEGLGWVEAALGRVNAYAVPIKDQAARSARAYISTKEPCSRRERHSSRRERGRPRLLPFPAAPAIRRPSPTLCWAWPVLRWASASLSRAGAH